MLTAALLAASLSAAPSFSQISPSPAWDRLKSLAGEWTGQAGDEKSPAAVEVRVTGDGSAVMMLMDKGTPHEMVTMVHPDGKDIVATHYCSAHNQPRLRLVPGTRADQLVFEFKDGTNLAPGDGHMERLALTFIDQNHHREDWSYTGGGKPKTFDLQRGGKTP